jgi:hypothetical protein
LKKVVEHSLPGSEMGSPHWMPSLQVEHGLCDWEGVGVLVGVTSHGEGVGVPDGDAPCDLERVTEALALRESEAVPVDEREAWQESVALLVADCMNGETGIDRWKTGANVSSDSDACSNMRRLTAGDTSGPNARHT